MSLNGHRDMLCFCISDQNLSYNVHDLTVKHTIDNKLFDCVKFLTVLPKAFDYLCRTPKITAVGTVFNVFNYNSVGGRYSNLSHTQLQAEVLCIIPQSRIRFNPYIKININY